MDQQRPSVLTAMFWLVIDLALVVAFAVVGNYFHDSGLSPAEVIATAWPFIAGLLLGWVLTFSWHRPHDLWPVGVFLVVVTVGAGMLMRHFFTAGGVQIPFVIVTIATLSLLLIGRRIISKQFQPSR